MTYPIGVSNIFELLDDETDENPSVRPTQLNKTQEEPNKKVPAAKATAPVKAAVKVVGDKGVNKAQNQRTDRADRGPRKPRAEGDVERRSGPRPPRQEGGEGFSAPKRENRRQEGKPQHSREGGQPSTDSRQKRVYDRKSGTGRGKEVKKGGATKGGWGTGLEVVEDVNAPAEEAAAVVEEEVPRELTEEEKAKAEAEQKEREAEEKQITLDDFAKLREEKKKGLPQLPAPRQAGEGVDEKTKKSWGSVAHKAEETSTTEETEEKKEKSGEKKSKKGEQVRLDQLFDVIKKPTNNDRPDRRDRDRDRPPRKEGDRPPRKGGDRPPRTEGDRPPRERAPRQDRNADRPPRGPRESVPRGDRSDRSSHSTPRGSKGAEAPPKDTSHYPSL